MAYADADEHRGRVALEQPAQFIFAELAEHAEVVLARRLIFVGQAAGVQFHGGALAVRQGILAHDVVEAPHDHGPAVEAVD